MGHNSWFESKTHQAITTAKYFHMEQSEFSISLKDYDKPYNKDVKRNRWRMNIQAENRECSHNITKFHSNC